MPRGPRTARAKPRAAQSANSRAPAVSANPYWQPLVAIVLGLLVSVILGRAVLLAQSLKSDLPQPIVAGR